MCNRPHQLIVLAALLWSTTFAIADASQQFITYNFSGVFTNSVTSGPTSIQAGDVFQASYTFVWPSSEIVIGPGLSQHSFATASVSAQMGTNLYASSNPSIYLWEPPVSDETISIESLSGGRTVRVVLASSDPSAVNQHVIPLALSLSQFDLRREFQVFGDGINIIGRIDSITVVPEPGVCALMLTGSLGLVVFRRLRVEPFDIR